MTLIYTSRAPLFLSCGMLLLCANRLLFFFFGFDIEGPLLFSAKTLYGSRPRINGFGRRDRNNRKVVNHQVGEMSRYSRVPYSLYL